MLQFPLRAVVVVTLAWLLFALSVLAQACLSLLLLPALPMILFGQVCLLSSAHEYARSVARPGRPAPARAPVPVPRAARA